MKKRNRLCPAMIACLAALLVLLWIRGACSQETSSARAASHELWIFFSPEAPPLASDLERLGATLRKSPGIVPRPVLLASELVRLRKPGKELAEAVKALQTLQGEAFGLQVLDEAGLARAKDLGIDRLPAYALLEAPSRTGPRRAFVAAGLGVKFEELLR